MKLDLTVGDSVFILGKGAGRVERVNIDGGFEVSVPGRTTPLYLQADGTIGGSGRQMAYYYDPIIVSPMKDLRLWAAYKRIAAQLYEELAAVSGVA